MNKTAEAVTPNHPDKLCDRISDAFLDECLKQDPFSRVAIETMGGHGIITVTGELTTKAFVNPHDIIKRIVGDKYGIQTNIVQQSPEISGGVDIGGAGDQGICVGYACDDNEALIPHELYLARLLAQFIYHIHPYDGKTQITLNEDFEIEAIVASFQNTKKEELIGNIKEWLQINKLPTTRPFKILANAAGDWKIGGFEADTGLTGRKLMVDNYGPQVAIGGGCFSGKDATKVDRSGAYMARKIAVDYLEKLKKQGEENIKVWVKLAYAIGIAEPVMATIECDFKTGFEKVDLLKHDWYDLTPLGIINALKLRKPQFEETAQWGHFGHNFNWEK